MQENTKNKIWLLTIIGILFLIIILSNNLEFNNYTTGLANANLSLNVISITAPAINTISNKIVNVGDTLSFYVNASDTDNDTLTFSDNCSFFNITSGTGLISFLAKYENKGTYSCKITVSDGSNDNFTIFNISIITECGDSTCTPDESCSTCSIDCGICPAEDIPSSGGTSTTPSQYVEPPKCTPEYSCTDWSDCNKDEYSYRTCNLLNSCSSEDLPLTKKPCSYVPSKLETEISISNEIAKTNPETAIEKSEEILSIKEEDVILLTELRFEDWEIFKLSQESFNEIKELIQELKKDIEFTKQTIDEETYIQIINNNGRLEEIVRQLPTVIAESKECDGEIAYLADAVNKETLKTAINYNEDMSITKCFKNYIIQKPNPLDNTSIKIAKVDIELKIDKDIDESYIIEVIPKDIAKSMKDVKIYNEEDIIILKDDPIFAWRVKDVKKGSIIKLSYIVKNNFANASAETGAVKSLDIKETKITETLGLAVNKAKTTCDVINIYKLISIGLLIVLFLTLIISNLMLPLDKYIKTDNERYKYGYMMYLLNTICYYSIYVFATYIIIIDLICFDKTILKEIMVSIIAMSVTYFMNKPLRNRFKHYRFNRSK